MAAIRAELDFSLDDAADLIGCSKSMLSRLERGQRRASPRMKVKIARRLGVRVSEIFPLVDDLDDKDGA